MMPIKTIHHGCLALFYLLFMNSLSVKFVFLKTNSLKAPFMPPTNSTQLQLLMAAVTGAEVITWVLMMYLELQSLVHQSSHHNMKTKKRPRNSERRSLKIPSQEKLQEDWGLKSAQSCCPHWQRRRRMRGPPRHLPALSKSFGGWVGSDCGDKNCQPGSSPVEAERQSDKATAGKNPHHKHQVLRGRAWRQRR